MESFKLKQVHHIYVCECLEYPNCSQYILQFLLQVLDGHYIITFYSYKGNIWLNSTVSVFCVCLYLHNSVLHTYISIVPMEIVGVILMKGHQKWII